jgi:hypothetical protein
MSAMAANESRTYHISEESQQFLQRHRLILEDWKDRNGNKSPASTTEGALRAADFWAKHPAFAASDNI